MKIKVIFTLAIILLSLLLAYSSFSQGTQAGLLNNCESSIDRLVNDGFLHDERLLMGGLIPEGEAKLYQITLYRGNEYMIIGCGDETVEDLDMIILDQDSNEVGEVQLSSLGKPFSSIYIGQPPYSGEYIVVVVISKSQNPDGYFGAFLGYK